jgi:alpha-1,2-mannosyltransferase
VTPSRTPSRTRWLRTWAPAELALAAYIASATVCCLLVARRHDAFGDLLIYRSGGQAVLNGARLYQLQFAWQLHFTYPPFAALVFVPLAWVPWAVVPPLVMALNVVALPLALWLALRLLPAARAARGPHDPVETESPAPHAWLAGWRAVTLSLAASSAAIWLEPVRTNLVYGQVNLLLAVLVLADLALGDRFRAKGAAIGIAAGLKLTPAIFAVYLVLTRRYRAAAVSAAVSGLTVAAGWALLPADSAAFWGGAFADPARIGRVENAGNQSLRGALARLLHTLSVQPPWLAAAAVVGLGGMTLAVLAGRRGDEASGFGRCAVTGLLISPVSWSHHWVLAVPALMLAAAGAWRRRSIPALAALALLAAVAGAGWARVIWHVPNGGAAGLHLNLLQFAAADVYLLAGLGALAVAAAQELSGVLSRPAGPRSAAADAVALPSESNAAGVATRPE